MSDEQKVSVTVNVIESSTQKKTETTWSFPQGLADLIRNAGFAFESFSKLKDAELKELKEINQRLAALEAGSGNGDHSKELEELRKKTRNQATHINSLTQKLLLQTGRQPWREKGEKKVTAPVETIPTQVTTENQQPAKKEVVVRNNRRGGADSRINTSLRDQMQKSSTVAPATPVATAG